MYCVFFSSVLGGIFLLLALVLRERSQKSGEERLKKSIVETKRGTTFKEVDDYLQSVKKSEQSDQKIKDKI
jgi:hypothetical protein